MTGAEVLVVDEHADGIEPQRRWWAGVDLTVVLVAAVSIAAFLALVGADLNGSSIGSFRNGQDDPNLVVGVPRSIRSDEWIIATPTSVGGDRVGLPPTRQLGLTDTDVLIASHGGPANAWFSAFRPQDWGYLLFGPSRGLAWHWWASFVVCLVGLTWLFRTLRTSPAAAVALATAGTFSPYTAWWTAPSTALFIGFAGLAVSAAMAALRARSLTGALVWSALTAWAVLCLVAPLYPPWIVSIGLAVGALLVGLVVDTRPSRRSLLRTGLLIGVPCVLAGLAFYVQHAAAIRASADTIYPGQRRSEGGGGSLEQLLSAPLNPWLVDAQVNTSELSAPWIPIGIVVAAMVLLLQRRRSGPPDLGAPVVRRRAVVVALAVPSALFVTWALVPVPQGLGRLLLLDRVPGERMPLALGFLGLLWIAVALSDVSATRRVDLVTLGIGALVSAAATVWAWQQFDVLGSAAGWLVLLSALVLPAALAALFVPRVRPVGALATVLYCFGVWVCVNPLYRGLGALSDEPIVTAMAEVVAADPDARVVVFSDATEGGNTQLSALVTASGVDTLSATTYYADPELMEQALPGLEGLWNNFARYQWMDDPAADRAVLSPLAADRLELRIDPCGTSAEVFDFDVVVADHPLDAYDCLTHVRTVPWNGTGRNIFVSEVTSRS